MSLSVHALHGCAPTPLAHYLKALGVLRLVTLQADKAARGFWKDGVFFLATTLDEDALVRFFLDQYEPTPMLSPWNGGSGFYFQEAKLDDVDETTGKKKKSGIRNQPTAATRALDALRNTTDARVAEFRRALSFAQEHVAKWQLTKAPEKADGKDAFVASVRNGSPVSLLPWVNASSIILDDRAVRAAYPSLLGTGGNEGNLDYSNNFIQHVMSTVCSTQSREQREWAVRSMLFRTVSDAGEASSTGQFFPGATGGVNATSGFDGESRVNPWDFLVMLEGAITLRVASLRRLNVSELAKLAAPFALRSQPSGFASASPKESSERGEQWLPLWSGPATFAEVSSLFAEARLQGDRRSAQSTLDATRAMAGLGVARGVKSFVRFGYVLRNGDRSAFAVPLGLLSVEHRPDVRLLDELEGFLRPLQRAADDGAAPLSLSRNRRALETAMLAASLPSATSATWGELVSVLGEVEQGFLAHGRATMDARLRPLPRLSARWIDRIDDGSAEVRLACAIASQTDAHLGPLRANAIPIDHGGYGFRTTAASLAIDPRHVWQGRSLVANLAAVALRRTIDGIRGAATAFPPSWKTDGLSGGHLLVPRGPGR